MQHVFKISNKQADLVDFSKPLRGRFQKIQGLSLGGKVKHLGICVFFALLGSKPQGLSKGIQQPFASEHWLAIFVAILLGNVCLEAD